VVLLAADGLGETLRLRRQRPVVLARAVFVAATRKSLGRLEFRIGLEKGVPVGPSTKVGFCAPANSEMLRGPCETSAVSAILGDFELIDSRFGWQTETRPT
jgi:hypothetical protein